MDKKEHLTSLEWNLLRALEVEQRYITKEQQNWTTKTWLKKRIQELRQRAGEAPST
jgi:hypothetical protein